MSNLWRADVDHSLRSMWSRFRNSLQGPRHPKTVAGYLRMLWYDFVIHPLFEGTEICEDCGRLYVLWYAPEDLWELAMGCPAGLLCPACFSERCEEKGVVVEFKATVFLDKRAVAP